MSTGRTAATVPVVILPVSGEVSRGAGGIAGCAQAARLKESAINSQGRTRCERVLRIIVILM